MPLVVDLETTTHDKGNPYHFDNYVVTIGLYNDEIQEVFDIVSNPKDLKKVKEIVENTDIIVGFNLKFDMTWLRKLGIDTSHITYWDCQVVEYKMSGHRHNIQELSMDACLRRRGLPVKIDKIAEYWEQGIQTDQIPRKELLEYNLQDVRVNWLLYLAQLEEMTPDLYPICQLANEDIKVLMDIEWNGLEHDDEQAIKDITANEKLVAETTTELNKLHDIPDFNWNSSVHLSAFLYGGIIPGIVKEPDGVYKSGARKGELKLKNRKVEYRLKRRYKPDPRQKTKRDGVWSTSESWLDRLPEDGPGAMIKLIRNLTKINSTFLRNNISFVREDGLIHANFNNTLTNTGRLSSNRPNLQNQPSEALKLFVTRYS